MKLENVVLAMTSLGFIFCFSLLFFSIILATASSEARSRQLNDHAALFVFGDSLYDPGNNNFLNISSGYKANYPPYGETFFKFPTGRFSDGRLIPDFIAKYANLPYWKPYLEPGQREFVNGANFASGGACVLPENDLNTLNIHIQLRKFKNVSSLLQQQLGDAEAKKLLMNAVYLFNIGGNDCWVFESSYPNATQSQKQKYANTVIGNITDVVKEIYEVGGRKFAFQNIAFMGCQPSIKQFYDLNEGECYDGISELAMLFNSVQVNVTRRLEIQLPGFKYLIFDFYTLLVDMTYNPSKYALKVVDDGCCGNGTYQGTDCGIGDYEFCSDPYDYMYWDGAHLTEHANSEVANSMWSGETNITAPLNLKQLFELELADINNFLDYDEASAEE